MEMAAQGRDRLYNGADKEILVSSKTSKTDAEAKFARTQKRATEAARAVSDAQAEAKRIDDNTARLRALRLARDAREAADRAAGVVPATAKPKVAKAAPKAAKAIPVKRLNARNDG